MTLLEANKVRDHRKTQEESKRFEKSWVLPRRSGGNARQRIGA